MTGETEHAGASAQMAAPCSAVSDAENVWADVKDAMANRGINAATQQHINAHWFVDGRPSSAPMNPLLIRLGLSKHMIAEDQFHPDHEKQRLEPKAKSLLTEMTPLWCSDIDGTLFRRRKDGLHPDVAAMVAFWMSCGGAFHVLSAGSAAGLARDGLDLVQRIGDEMQRLSLVNAPGRVIQELMRFQMSNGASVYSVINPSAQLGSGQLRFEQGPSIWMSEKAAAALHTFFEAEGFQVLAMDDDELSNMERAVSVFFLKHPFAEQPKDAIELETRINRHLEKEHAPARILWLGGQRGRFDVFPVVNGEMVTKDTIFRAESILHESVFFTGDRYLETYPDGSRGSDYPIVALEKTVSHVQVEGVDGPIDVCRALMPHLIRLMKRTLGAQGLRDELHGQQRLSELIRTYGHEDLLIEHAEVASSPAGRAV